MDKYMKVNICTTGIYDLSKEKMSVDEMQKLNSEEHILEQIGKVEYVNREEN